MSGATEERPRTVELDRGSLYSYDGNYTTYLDAKAERRDVDRAHTEASAGKLARLEQQRTDLAGCFDALLAEARAGRAYFKVYRQFKMYNDPRFNPALVKERQGT